jgi:hypothetical protein
MASIMFDSFHCKPQVLAYLILSVTVVTCWQDQFFLDIRAIKRVIYAEIEAFVKSNGGDT